MFLLLVFVSFDVFVPSRYVEFFFLLFNVSGLFRLRRYDTFFPDSSLVVVFLSLVFSRAVKC